MNGGQSGGRSEHNSTIIRRFRGGAYMYYNYIMICMVPVYPGTGNNMYRSAPAHFVAPFLPYLVLGIVMHAAAVGRRPSALTSASRRSLVSTRESLSVGRRSAKELTRRSARTPRRNVGSLIKFFDPSSSQPRDQPTEQPEEQPVEPPPVFVVPADLDALPPRDTMTDFFSPVPTEPDYLSMFAADAKADEGRVPWWRAPHIAWLLLFFGWLVITAAAVQAPELSLEIWQGQQRVLDLNNIRERLQLPTIRDPWRQATSYVDAASLDAKWQAATF